MNIFRQKAEALVASKFGNTIVADAKEAKEQLHELQVHQIQLEMQNEELRIIQQELETSRAKYHDLYNRAPVGYFTLSEQGIIVEANTTAADMLGIDINLLINQSIFNFIFKEDQDIYYLHRKIIFESGMNHSLEIRMINGKNVHFWVHIECVFARNEKNEKVSRVTISNIDERKEAEEQLRLQETKYRSIFENSNDAIILLDMETGKYVECNLIMQSLSGYSQQELYNMSAGALVLAAKSKEISSNIENVKTNKSLRGETEILAKDGTRIPVEYNSSLIELKNKLYTLSIVRDISERKLTEKKLERHANELSVTIKDLESFSYSVSHDLRNPLNVITTNIEVLELEIGTCIAKDAKSAMDNIIKATQRMAQVITDLMTLSGISRQELKIETVDISIIFQDFIAELQKSNPKRNVQFNIQSDLFVDADPGLMRILLENFARNAWKFTSKKETAHIELGSMYRDGELCYFIRDDGVGFDMEQHSKIFKPYQRLHSAREYKGSGIGMAIAKRIVDKHNGSIWAEGEKDKGATFFFRLGRH